MVSEWLAYASNPPLPLNFALQTKVLTGRSTLNSSKRMMQWLNQMLLRLLQDWDIFS